MSSQAIAMLINAGVVLLVILGTFLLVTKMKFEDNNSRVIFLLYIVYWVAPLLCRDYTTSMHIHMGFEHAAETMWIPVASFGAIGILWRPLNDILAYKAKSRKLIIFLSIGIQALTLLPFLLYPCFITNVIQSIGTGIGASGIGLFTLMFNEGQSRNKKFLTVSIFALPPIIAGLLVSALESFVASYTPEDHTTAQYVSVIWYIWLIALIFVLISFIMAFFVGEKKETLYQEQKYKEPVVKSVGHLKVALICVCGVLLALFRWATAGPYAGMQLTYIASFNPHNTSLWEGYLGLVYSVGCLVGSIFSALAIVKCKTNKYQPVLVVFACAVWIAYLVLTFTYVNVPMYFWSEMVNGFGFGLLWNIFLEIVLNKFYPKRNIVTPIGFYNMSLSVGIVIGAMLIGFTKAKYFDFHAVTRPEVSEFLKTNKMISIALICVTALLIAAFIYYYVLESWSKTKKKLKPRSVAMIGENEL